MYLLFFSLNLQELCDIMGMGHFESHFQNIWESFRFRLEVLEGVLVVH